MGKFRQRIRQDEKMVRGIRAAEHEEPGICRSPVWCGCYPMLTNPWRDSRRVIACAWRHVVFELTRTMRYGLACGVVWYGVVWCAGVVLRCAVWVVCLCCGSWPISTYRQVTVLCSEINSLASWPCLCVRWTIVHYRLHPPTYTGCPRV